MAHKRLGFMQLSIICGFSLYYAWYLITFFGVFISTPSNAEFIERHAGQVLFFVGSLLATQTLLIMFRKANSVAIGHTRFLYLGSLIPGSFVPIAAILDSAGIALPLPVFYIASVLSGASVAFGFMLWEDLSVHGYLRRNVLAHGVIFCAGGIIFLACTALLTALQLAIIAEVLLCLSTALLTFITPRCDTLENRPVGPVRDYFKSVWHVDVVVIVIGIAFGFAFIMLYKIGTVPLLVVMAIATGVDFLFSILLGGEKWIPFVGLVRICAALVACAMLLYVCPIDSLRMIALCVIVIFWFIFRTINGGSLVDLARRNDFSILYASTRGKMPANIGFTIGLAIGLIVTAANVHLLDLYVPLAIVAAFILAALFFLPFDNEGATAGYKTISLVDIYKSQDAVHSGTDALCEHASKIYKLSPRESEVLVYVIRGRNAKHVAEKLYISESTAKTHIANIYRKAGVHSQQELLDKIEEL